MAGLHTVITIICLVLVHVVVCLSSNCTQLKIMNGDIEVKSDQICVIEYTTPGCIKFAESFNKSDLPSGFPTSTLAVERPSQLSLQPLINDYNNSGIMYKIPGLVVSWQPPVSELSRKNLEGYLFIWQQNATLSCRLLQFNTSSLLLLKPLTFSYTIQSIKQASNYTVTIYSLPTPDFQYKEDGDRFQRKKITSFSAYAVGTNPSLWTPFVLVNTYSYGALEVRFTLSPPEFNLTKFEILLLKKSFSTANSFIIEEYFGKVATLTEPEGFVVFKNLSSDSYLVVVRAVDQLSYSSNHCLCWRKIENSLCTNFRCCETCGSISTAWYDLNVTVSTPSISSSTPSISAPAITDSSTAATISTSPASSTLPIYQIIPGLSDGEIAALAIGLIVAVAFIIFIILMCYRRKSNLSEMLQKVISWACPEQNFQVKPPDNASSGSPPTEVAVDPILTVKRLYIMSADDHPKHVEMVKALADFLKVHGHCEVIYPPMAQDLHQFNTSYSWFISKIPQADHIVFVDSLGAAKLIDAHLHNKIYEDRELGPEGDLFTECLKYVFADEKARNKIKNINFESTQAESTYVFPSEYYTIPKCLPKFLKKLHLIYKDGEKFQSQLPLLKENLPNLPLGARLYQSLNAIKQYEKENPDWLEKSFSHATPLDTPTVAPPLQTLLSNVSGDSGVSGLGPRSVSDPDLRDSGHYSQGQYDPDDPTYSIITVPAEPWTNPDTQSSFARNIIPPDAVSDSSIFTRLGQINDCNSGHLQYQNQGQGQHSMGHILPPETMSAVDDISQAIMNINRLSEETWNNKYSQC